MTKEENDLLDAMRSNIAAKEVIWGSLIQDNIELGQAIHGIVDAFYGGYDEEIEAALDQALKLANSGSYLQKYLSKRRKQGGVICGQ